MIFSSVIVPLAGPDFIDKNGKSKAEIILDSDPLLLSVLSTRPWYDEGSSDKFIFVLFDSHHTRSFSKRCLLNWFPNCKTIFLSEYTRGAALSSLSALSLIKDFNKPIIVDLADISYEYNCKNLNFEAENLGAIALTFISNNKDYSYLSFDELGSFVVAKEKEVISENASAGTYIFRNFSILAQSIGLAVDDEKNQTFNDLFYVCPLFNKVKELGYKVISHQVDNVKDIKIK